MDYYIGLLDFHFEKKPEFISNSEIQLFFKEYSLQNNLEAINSIYSLFNKLGLYRKAIVDLKNYSSNQKLLPPLYDKFINSAVTA